MDNRPRVVLVAACLAVFVVILDATIVAVALPDIQAQLGAPGGQLAWVMNAYTLVFAGFLLLGGRCADVYGHRAVLVAGTVVFTVASVGAGLATSPGVLVAARAAQGLGGALMLPATLATVNTSFAGAARSRALASWSVVGACGGTVGTLLGGVLTQWAGWRWIFLVNLPLGAAAVALAVRALPRASVRRGPARARLDVPGAVLATLGLTALVFAIMSAGRGGGRALDVTSVVAAVLGLALLAAFVAHSRWWAMSPLMPLSVFRAPGVSSGNAVMFLIGLGFFASPVLLSLYLQTVRHETPFAAGLAFLPGAVGLIAGGRCAGRTTTALGPRRAAVLGLVPAGVGFAALGVLTGQARPGTAALLAAVAVSGLGIGAAFTPITVAATAAVPARHSGVAAGVLNTIRQASGAIGLAVLTKVATGSGARGYSAAYAVAAVCALAAALLAGLTLPRRRAATPTPDGPAR